MIAGIVSEGVENGICFQELQPIAMVVKALFKLLHGASIVSDVGIEDGLPAWPIGFARASFELFLPEAPQTTCLERGMQACNLGGCTTVRFEVGRKGVQRHTFRFVSLSHPVVR